MPYATYSYKQLQAMIEPHTAVDTETSASGAIVCTEQGARLLGLFPRLDLPNVLWVHEEVGKRLGQGHWMVGGERMWIAPERAFYYENPRDFGGFHVPTELDPGNFQRTADMSYENTFSLLDMRTSELYDECTARRSIEPIDDPYSSGLSYAGVRIRDTLTVPTTSLAFCAWTISMVYTAGPGRAGTALFPCRPGTQLLSYFDPIPAARAECRDGYARFAIDGAATYKLAIAPEDILHENQCKGVYLSAYPCEDLWFCVVKRGSDIPRSQAECVDEARGNPDGAKGAIQSYNNGRRDGDVDDCPFGEIELQLPLAHSDGLKSTSSGTHELLAYAGSRAEVTALAQNALGLRDAPVLY